METGTEEFLLNLGNERTWFHGSALLLTYNISFKKEQRNEPGKIEMLKSLVHDKNLNSDVISKKCLYWFDP